MKKIKWGEKRYYTDFKDNSYMNTKVLKEKKIRNDYKYLPRSILVKVLRFLFYYFMAAPILYFVAKIKYGVKVNGRKNLKKVKGGAILIGNHTNPFDCAFASVFVGLPKRNYFICNKDAVQVVIGKYFTKALGALPLPDEPKGLINLSNAVDSLVKKGNYVTIYPETCIWPYYTKLRPLASANFHYAVKSEVPIIPFAVTYRYARGKNYLRKKPKVNISICEPIYPNKELRAIEAKQDLADKTTQVLKSVIEIEDNVALYEYLPIKEKLKNK